MRDVIQVPEAPGGADRRSSAQPAITSEKARSAVTVKPPFLRRFARDRLM